MVEHPKETIDFELDKHVYIMDLVQEIGSDGRLILDQENAVHHVNMFQKLLVLLCFPPTVFKHQWFYCVCLSKMEKAHSGI